LLTLIHLKNRKAKEDLFDFYYGDISYSPSLEAFDVIKNNSECIFAKRSNLWSTPNRWNSNLTIRENVTL